MAQKMKYNDIMEIWEKGWIVIPSSLDSTNYFPTTIGRFLVNKFIDLEKNYARLCELKKGPYVVFRNTFSKAKKDVKILAYHDLRDPLSPTDTGVIILPDTDKISEMYLDTKTDWEVIEKSINYLKSIINIIPNNIYMPPLGYGNDRIDQDEAIDDLMGAFLDYNNVCIVYDIEITDETVSSSGEVQIANNTANENIVVSNSNGSLIQNEFETI